jgi:pimeloyl-ACP methyl ester carboxylesterase
MALLLALTGVLVLQGDRLAAALVSQVGAADEGPITPAGDQGAAGPPTVAPPVPVLPARDVQVPATPDHPGYTLYLPEGPDEPRPALLVLHGMNGSGPGMASLLLPYARSQGWAVIAPTMPYGNDWRDPASLAEEELRLLPQLATLLDAVPAETGAVLHNRVLIFGFSRGGQAGLRFTMFSPERVQAVASLSAGTYTLPAPIVKTVAGAIMPAPMPFGVAGLEQRLGHPIDLQALSTVRFLIGVGANDNREGDVPRQWDPYIGKTRLERAQRFADVLAQLGFQVQVAIVPGAAHEVNAAMLEPVLAFLTDAARQLRAEPPAPQGPTAAPLDGAEAAGAAPGALSALARPAVPRGV